MNYNEARKYIQQVTMEKGSVLSLDAVKGLLNDMNNPQDSLNVIHVAGTNGKGSVISYLASILMEEGYRVGRYISPSVFEYLERIQINNQNISQEDYAKYIGDIKEYIDVRRANKMTLPTAFEIETAAAFDYFLDEKCDIVLLETGMGGSLDGTNVCTEVLVSVIMSVSMDHMQFLGNTLTEIAEKKAGIIKYGCPVVMLRQSDEVMQVVYDYAKEMNAPVVVTGRNQIEKMTMSETVFTYKSVENVYENLKIHILGGFQVGNACVAVEAVEQLRKQHIKINDASVRTGLEKARWGGRFEVIGHNPLMLIDGAHNPGASKVFAEAVKKYFEDYHIIFIMGVLADKDYTREINDTAKLAEYIITVTPDNYRALKAEKLKAAIYDINNNVVEADDVSDALYRAKKYYNDIKDDKKIIIAFGSLSYLGSLKQAYIIENH